MNNIQKEITQIDRKLVCLDAKIEKAYQENNGMTLLVLYEEQDAFLMAHTIYSLLKKKEEERKALEDDEPPFLGVDF